MSNNLSSTTRALLDAAKHDGPSREKRAAMWTGITGGVITHPPPQIKVEGQPQGTGAAGAAKGTLWAGTSMPAVATKAAFIGALFGSAISIGIATFMLHAKNEPPPVTQSVVMSPGRAASLRASGNANTNAPQNVQASNGGTTIELPSTPADPIANAQSAENSSESAKSQRATQGASDARPSTSKSPSHAASHAKKNDSAGSESPDDMLSREVALVAEARRELLTGDPAAALKSVRAARSLEARQMEPDEMGLEAKALRALGRDSEAERVESQLRTMYPGR